LLTIQVELPIQPNLTPAANQWPKAMNNNMNCRLSKGPLVHVPNFTMMRLLNLP